MNHLFAGNQKTNIYQNSREHLHRLLSQIIEYPDRRTEITGIIEQLFGEEKAVLVLDMSGFSRTTQRFGIISFLLMIHQMRSICEPCIQQHQGILIKSDADNLFCLFDSVVDAVNASREINDRLSTANLVLPAEQQLYASFGIGYGTVLNIANEDLFGNEVNLASKLGEDIAAQGEILLSAAAKAQLGEAEVDMQAEDISISGILLTYYALKSTMR